MDGPQGGYKVLNLVTGKVITSHELYELRITALVQGRVEELGREDGIAPVLAFVNPLVEDSDADVDDFPSIAGVEDDDATAATEAETIETNHEDDDDGHCHLTNDEIEIVDLTDDDDNDAEEELCQNAKAQLNVNPSTPATTANAPQGTVTIKQEEHSVNEIIADSELKMEQLEQELQALQEESKRLTGNTGSIWRSRSILQKQILCQQQCWNDVLLQTRSEISSKTDCPKGNP